jgi:hypothetical protein
MAKSAWLQEVEDDAVRITEKRFRDQLEELEYKKSKTEVEVESSDEVDADDEDEKESK